MSCCSIDIPFETENELKKKGTSKTPDILLSCPVGLKVQVPKQQNHNSKSGNDKNDYEWKMINWIDSKVSCAVKNNTLVFMESETLHFFSSSDHLFLTL